MKRITVGLRLKPENSKEYSDLLTLKDKTIEVTLSGQKYEYNFDDIFDGNSTNDNVFNVSCRQLVENVIDGYNGCIFAYGQTGAGKTHTMSGPQDNFNERGLCLRAAAHLFENSRKITTSSGDSFSIRMSALEIYNEAIIDILRESTQQQGITPPVQPKLSIFDSVNGVIVPTLFLLPLVSEEDAYTALMEAYVNRISASHNLNKRSSRSHAIYTFYITRSKVVNNKEPDVVQSKLHLVDLAGSERVEKSGSIQGIQKEANYINRSLSYLEQVVIALTQKDRDHIPYRQSKLTHLLKDSLGGNCNTYMIACVWPHRHHAWETISTLRFSQRMKAIVNTPIRNKLVTQDVISIKSQQQIDSLKKELALRDMIAGRETWLPTLTKAQQSNTIQQACNFAESIAKTKNNDDILDDYMEFQSLSQIRLTAETLKAIIWEACDQNQSKVTAIIEQFLRIQNVTRDHNNDPVDIPNQGFTDVDEMYETRPDNNADVIYDNNNNVTEVNSSPTKLQESPSKQMLTFEEFKVLFLSLLFIVALTNKFIRKQNMVKYYTNRMYKHVMNCKPSNTGIYIFAILNTFF